MEEICAGRKKYSTCLSKNYLQIEEVFPIYIEDLYVDWNIICKSKNCVQVRSAARRSTLSADQKIICKSNNYQQMEELSAEIYADWRSLRSTNRRIICKLREYTICRSRKSLQMKELSAEQKLCIDQSSICRSKNYSICRSKSYLQLKELSVDWRNMCKSKNYSIFRLRDYLQVEEVFNLQIEELSPDWEIIRRSKVYVQGKSLSSHNSSISRLNTFSITKLSDLQIVLQSQDNSSICR